MWIDLAYYPEENAIYMQALIWNKRCTNTLYAKLYNEIHVEYSTNADEMNRMY
jgi:hypothetical protein